MHAVSMIVIKEKYRKCKKEDNVSVIRDKKEVHELIATTVLIRLFAGSRDWVGENAWSYLPKIKVALSVHADELVEWVLDRMKR